jgi:caa(3)-type oxidase subunit IV
MVVKPRAFYTIVWVILVGATLMEVFTRSLSMALSVIVVIIILIACVKAALIALYYQGLRHEPWALGLLPFVSFIIVALLAITSLLMASMGGMSGMSM